MWITRFPTFPTTHGGIRAGHNTRSVRNQHGIVDFGSLLGDKSSLEIGLSRRLVDSGVRGGEAVIQSLAMVS